MNEGISDDVVERVLANVRAKTMDHGERVSIRSVREYVDPARHELEMRRLFGDQPIFVGHTSQIRNPGDFFTENRLGPPLLLVRNEDGGISAFLNMCRHRGAIVEPAPCGHRTDFICPYHNWSYGLDGSLRKVPDESSFTGAPLDGLGLRPVPVADAHGLIFVRPGSQEPIDLSAFLSGLNDDFAALNVADFHYFGTRSSPLKCNWKLAVDGALETYHFNILHASSAARHFTGARTVHDFHDLHQRYLLPRRTILRNIEQGGNAREDILPNYHLFPNTFFTMAGDHVIVIQVFADGVDQCFFVNSLLTATPVASKKEEGYWERLMKFSESVNDEDFVIAEGIQRTIAARPDEQVIYGRGEYGITHFHENCDQILAAVSTTIRP